MGSRDSKEGLNCPPQKGRDGPRGRGSRTPASLLLWTRQRGLPSLHGAEYGRPQLPVNGTHWEGRTDGL